MNYKIVIFISAILLFQSSCSLLPKKIDPANCSKINQELNSRSSLFKKLSIAEIKTRQATDIPTFSSLTDESVISKIASGITRTKTNSKLIAIDLRFYNDVPLGNIIIANIENDLQLDLFLKTSKYSQGFFAVVNFNDQKITIIPPKIFPNNVKSAFKKTVIERSDLGNSELIINVSNANNISGNMKFSEGQQVSILANNVTKPYRLDIREASNLQFHSNKKWIMPVYSIEENYIDGGKDTGGIFKFINNKNTKKIILDKFDKSQAQCYSNPLGPKLETSVS